jgi:antitoxin (DNA-binding transcriptional repressor) of toxin-antitoxin stability system
MQSVEGVITLVQEGRFVVVTDGGRVMHFLLAHDASVEPQDLPLLKRDQRRVRVDFTEPSRLVAHVAHTLRTADDTSTERIEP